MSFKKFIRPTNLTFVDKKHIVDNVYSFSFTADTNLSWHAGQHGMLEVIKQNGRKSRRMFSLSSAPSEKIITITTRWHDNKASDYKKALWALTKGDKASIRGPVGPMYVKNYQDNNVFIAGGIGITPFRSMIFEALLAKKDLHGTLLYASKSKSESIFSKELSETIKKLPNFNFQEFISPNRITAEYIKKASKPSENTMYYISGPPAMIKSYKAMLKENSVSKKQIKSDPFMGYK
ncbi:FAD-dependent oxidoreductase [Candidatus Saccharibacteria bacterium]|nr:FAD-dependent oxidoreductase [Candidatus Saccharibacteria bacterium]